MTSKPVTVTWHDATSANQTWIGAEHYEDFHAEPNMECISVGWLTAETESYITIALSISFDRDGNEDAYGQSLKIPRGAIIDIKEMSALPVERS